MAQTKNTGGEFHGAAKGATPSISSYWQALVDAAGTGVVKVTADQNGNRYVIDANGQQVFTVPPRGGAFSAQAVYYTPEDAIATISTYTPGATKALEKELGLKPTGVPGNAALIQRYLAEANKASVYNMSAVLAKQNGTIGSFTQKPLDIVGQAQMSIKTGDISGGTRRSRSVSVTQFSEGDARAILEQFYADTLGRRPDDAEVKKFNALINKQARKQPSVSTTTYGADGSSTTMSGGAGYSAADAQMAARKMAEADPEASSFLASTRYLDAFMNAIGSQA